MAFFDNKYWLLHHINNSYISSDDTGICELVLSRDLMPNVNGEDQFLSVAGVKGIDKHPENDCSHGSFDIMSDLEFGGHRPRSNTAQRLDKLKQDRKIASKIQHIIWRERSKENSDDVESCFVKKEVLEPLEVIKKDSLLTQQLKIMDNAPVNPFRDFSRHDGSVTMGLPTRKLSIFLPNLPEDERAFPMVVVVLASATVKDLIGLICWKYTCMGKNPPLKYLVDDYCLCIAEDTGEIDYDFPPLDMRETIAKFGFNVYALAESKESGQQSQLDLATINVYGPSGEVFHIKMTSPSMLIQDILDQVQELRADQDKTKRTKLLYCLEKRDNPGFILPNDARVSDVCTNDFCIIRVNSKRDTGMSASPEIYNMGLFPNIDIQLHESFKVIQTHRLKSNMEVNIGISCDKLDIEPINAKSKFLSQPKVVSCKTQSIVACDLLEKDPKCFKIICISNQSYKTYCFETDTITAQTIVSKIKSIMEFQASSARSEYLQSKSRKSVSRLSFRSKENKIT